MSKKSQEVLEKIRKIHIQTKHAVSEMLAGSYHSSFKGQGIEAADLREYQIGDEIRSIDWNVSARMNKPFVKKFHEERELSINLLVDISSSMHFGTKDKLKSEAVAEIAGTLAFSAVQNSDKVSLISFAKDVIKYLPPAKGSKQVFRIIQELIEDNEESKGSEITKALSFLGKVRKKRGICFLISDFAYPQVQQEEYLRQIAITAKHFDLICIALRDEKEEQIPNLGLIEIEDLETKERLLVDSRLEENRSLLKNEKEKERQEQEKLIKEAGGDFCYISCQDSVIELLQKYFYLRQRKR